MKTALVIAAHPDDEILGCGATIARLVSEGWFIHVLIVAEGLTSRGALPDPEAVSDLAKSAEIANKIVGTSSIKFLGLPDNRMDKLELLDVVKMIEHAIVEFVPSLVFTHHIGDVNIDHRILHDAVITACRPQPNNPVKKILFFEVPSSTEWRPSSSGLYFSPNYFYDVSNFLDKKTEALLAYSSEMRQFPHPRSIEAVKHLAHWRGASIGCFAAEGFVLGRSIL